MKSNRTPNTLSAEDGTLQSTGVNPWLVLSSTGLGVVLVMINLGALNVALPAIARHFHAGAALSSWILLSFMLANTVLILVFGQFSDSFGRRKLFLYGMALFTILSLLIGFSSNIWVFLALRVMQAAGGALIITNNTALITDAFPEHSLGKGLGVNVLIASAAQLIGPVVGGIVASRLGWQWVFWAGVPVGLIGVLWGMVVLRGVGSKPSGKPIDWAGGGLTLIAVSSLIVALSEGSTLSWTSPVVLSCAAAFVVVTPILIWVQRRVESPMFDFALFRDRPYAMANLATFLNSFARISVVLLVSLYLQSMLKVGAYLAGMEVLPVTIGMLVASPIAGGLSNRWSARLLSTTGLLISAMGIVGLMITMQPGLPYAWNAVWMGLVGFGSGLFLTPNTKSIMTSVPADRRGFANGLRSMLQNMGQVLSTAISLTIVTAALPSRLQDMVYTGSEQAISRGDLFLVTNGYRMAFGGLLIATVLGMVASSLRGRTTPPTHTD